jgi:hypothetical protein
MASLNNPRVNRLEADVAAIKSQLDWLDKKMNHVREISDIKFDGVKAISDINLTSLRGDLRDLRTILK